MKRLRKLLRSEKGGYQMIEASIMYPFVFLIIIFVLYYGMYLIQMMAVSSYAQKIAVLAAREVACPGYYKLVSSQRLTTSATEIDFKTGGGDGTYSGNVALSNKASDSLVRAYRYFTHDPLTTKDPGIDENGFPKDPEVYYEGVLQGLTYSNSLLKGWGTQNNVQVELSCDNKFIAQYINVTIKQPLVRFGLLDYLGIGQITVEASAKASVSDTDELVRNTDFAADAINAIAERLGIDTSKIKETFKSCLAMLGKDGETEEATTAPPEEETTTTTTTTTTEPETPPEAPPEGEPEAEPT